jgi:hypothetical protein
MSKFADFINDELDPPVSIGLVRKYQSSGLKRYKYQMLLGKKNMMTSFVTHGQLSP